MTAFVPQVGGSHYLATYQHWDWVAQTGLGYLEGNATKYLGRFRKKGGRQDLEKAVSYLEKLVTVANYTGQPAGYRPLFNAYLTSEYLQSAGLMGYAEAGIIIQIDNWRSVIDLSLAIRHIKDMIDARPGG